MRAKSVKNLTHRTFDKINDISDGQICSDARRSIAEEYLDGRVNLHIHVRFDTEEYCALFDRNTEVVSSYGFLGTCPNQVHFPCEGSSSE